MTTPGVRLVAELAPDLPQLVQDQDKTRQILINLLSNAAKFTEAGTITVSATVRGDAIELAVADTGPGIAEEAQAKVFEEFGQVQGSNTKHRGTGLGLPISKRLANLLDGDLTLQSALGVGSTFTLSVPIRYGGRAPVAEPAAERMVEARTPADVAAAVEHEVGASDRRLVLAIDDDPDTIELLRENLAEIGYQVVGATSGADGLAKARALQPHAITLDIVMPDMDGWQVLHELKADPATRTIPVVVITVVDQAKLGYRLGAAAYLVKPFERDQLVATLGQIAPRCRRLLVVDDDPNVANLVRQLLEADGYAIEAAADGKVALRVLAERRPDAILLDLKMPEMDGFDVVRKLREDADRCDIPVIVLTAKLLTRMEERHLKEQVSAVMDKATLDQGALVEKLKRILPRAVRDDSNSDAAA
jgi:CheY-like chemotaxis protein/anti-sigma regulatory factor (Ser/Thr protein kinase)